MLSNVTAVLLIKGKDSMRNVLFQSKITFGGEINSIIDNINMIISKYTLEVR
tara:strand:- start:221 stop:376 length:156 start_codon:yes stop_codon:yes gene_type:complete